MGLTLLTLLFMVLASSSILFVLITLKRLDAALEKFWARTAEAPEPPRDYPIPPEGTTSYGTYNGRVVYLEEVGNQWGRSKAVRIKQMRLMTLVNNPKGYQFTLEPRHADYGEKHKIKQLFTINHDSHNLTGTLFKSYLVSPKLLKAHTQSHKFAVELQDGRLYYTQYNATDQDIDNALDLLSAIADSLDL